MRKANARILKDSGAFWWQITLIWIPMHPTLLPGVHFGMGRGAFNYGVGCKLLWGGVHLATGRGAFLEGGVHQGISLSARSITSASERLKMATFCSGYTLPGTR